MPPRPSTVRDRVRIFVTRIPYLRRSRRYGDGLAIRRPGDVGDGITRLAPPIRIPVFRSQNLISFPFPAANWEPSGENAALTLTPRLKLSRCSGDAAAILPGGGVEKIDVSVLVADCQRLGHRARRQAWVPTSGTSNAPCPFPRRGLRHDGYRPQPPKATCGCRVTMPSATRARGNEAVPKLPVLVSQTSTRHHRQRPASCRSGDHAVFSRQPGGLPLSVDRGLGPCLRLRRRREVAGTFWVTLPVEFPHSAPR